MKFPRTTLKRCHRTPWLSECGAHIVSIAGDWLELDATVAYPEGGGQDADHGEIVTPNGQILRFVDARKLYGEPLRLPDFPDIQVGGIVRHQIAEADVPLLASLTSGLQVTVRIDARRRAQLSLSHTASHLLYLGVAAVRPEALARVSGCHIRVDGARFDFNVSERFSPHDVASIGEVANGYVSRDSAVTVESLPTHPDARYWHCESATIPCGGTHLPRTGAIGPMLVRRKAMGRGKERLSCAFPHAQLDWQALFETSHALPEAG
ncbi:alanyl-tRNA editing protein [Chitinasiproducens palmae]|uniref:Alanyl-tRNA synthetase n=1 Tax=Chitinasiproducens palmae TaxID=1770053 RepID=A0A1H2PU90_9BURK|nr:alanyl-tRNA editing protein [Chitinasiproducens palmae]SDV50745.1 alanyl-tRNA synthetase [Chitinasiproducens palmae]